jgi:hypothetical protein
MLEQNAQASFLNDSGEPVSRYVLKYMHIFGEALARGVGMWQEWLGLLYAEPGRPGPVVRCTQAAARPYVRNSRKEER